MNRMVKTMGEAYYRALGYYPTSIHGLKYRLDPDHIGFWRTAAKGRWEPHTYKILSTLLNADSVYCDLGAWIGPTVVHAASICKQVFCFEPDPTAYRYLRWNIELNDLHNVTSYSIALSDQTAIRRMASFGGNLGNTTTSLLNTSRESAGADVLTLTWDAFITLSQTAKIDLLKIDIEGSEFALLPTMKEYLSLHKPAVYLSTHQGYLDARLKKEKMEQIMDIMGIYDRCLDQHLRPVSTHQLDLDSYVFTD